MAREQELQIQYNQQMLAAGGAQPLARAAASSSASLSGPQQQLALPAPPVEQAVAAPEVQPQLQMNQSQLALPAPQVTHALPTPSEENAGPSPAATTLVGHGVGDENKSNGQRVGLDSSNGKTTEEAKLEEPKLNGSVSNEARQSQPDQQVEETKPMTVTDSLQKLRLALDKRGGDSKIMKRPASKLDDSTDAPASQEKRNNNSKESAAMMKRPAAAPKASSSASAAKKKKTKESLTLNQIPRGDGKVMPSKAQRVRMVPYGCSTCRQIAGCTPSCWVKKGWVRRD